MIHTGPSDLLLFQHPYPRPHGRGYYMTALRASPGRLDPPRRVTRGIDPDFQKFDRALKTQVRPVLVSLQRLPFRDFRAEEFLGRTLTTCRGAGGCVSVFQGSSLTLGQMAEACIYVGGAPTSIRKRGGSILFRTVKIEPAEKGRSLNSRPIWP